MSDINEMNQGLRWYVAHTYSGYENKVKANLEKIVENRGLGEKIVDIRIPTEIGDINGKPAHTQKEWDDNLPNAEKVLADFKAAGGTEEAFIQLVKTVSDPDYQVNDGLVTKLTKHTIIAEDPDEPFAEAFKNWYLDPAREAGDVEIIKDDNGSVQGYQIMYYRGGTAIWRYEAQTLLLSEKTNAMLAEAETKWLEGRQLGELFTNMPTLGFYQSN